MLFFNVFHIRKIKISHAYGNEYVIEYVNFKMLETNLINQTCKILIYQLFTSVMKLLKLIISSSGNNRIE